VKSLKPEEAAVLALLRGCLAKEAERPAARAWERVANERQRQLRNQIDMHNGVNAFFERELTALA
jgi:hypothetical protein